jgi:hypothetical protein
VLGPNYNKPNISGVQVGARGEVHQSASKRAKADHTETSRDDNNARVGTQGDWNIGRQHDTKGDGRQRPGSIGSVSFSARVKMAFQGKLDTKDLVNQADSSNSSDIESVQLPGWVATKIPNSQFLELSDVHMEVIGALAPIQP